MSELSVSGVADPEAVVYLRQAASCYIIGLPQAAIALARAAIETPLRRNAAKHLGEKAVAGLELKDLLDEQDRRVRLLSRDGLSRAHKVRIAANKVLHVKPADSDVALEIVEAARRVVLELSQR